MAGYGVGFAMTLAFGLWLGSRPVGSTRGLWKWLGLAMAAVVALGLGTLMLAGLFNSTGLGWTGGLTLMVAMALVPFVAVLALGQWLGAKYFRPNAPPVAPPAPPSP